MEIIKYIEDILQNFVNMIQSITIFDVLDILILTFLVYYLIKLMRETRAMQLLKGIFLIIVIFMLVQIFQLKAMSFIIENFLQVGIIALIIVFQPELRRILEKVGRAKVSVLAQPFEKNAGDASVREKAIIGIADAVQRLHDSKTGALIVIERDIKLRDIIEKDNTAVIVNAEPEPDLFCNIFYNGSPLHDGAVIIRNNRIYAARCFLPTPEKDQYLSNDLGSRHRAAIGITEKSDALVIIVSEETGTVSVAFDQQLNRNKSREDIINILRKSMPGVSAKKKKTGKTKVEEG